MADAVVNNVIFQGGFRYALKMTCVCDGSGETNVVKIDISTLTLVNGQACTKLGIEEIEWDVQGFTYVKLSFDQTTDYTIGLLSGRGSVSYKHLGYAFDRGTGGTGDLLLSSVGGASGDTYDITVVVQLRG